MLQLIFETKLSKVTRSTSLQWYKTNRDKLGEDGTLSVFKCSKTGKIVVQYVNSDGKLMLDADAVESDVAKGTLKGNAGDDLAFYWDAVNRHHAAGGTIIKGAKDPDKSVGLRRYYFWFNHAGDLALAVYYIFGENKELFKAFYDRSSDLFVNEEEWVPHAVAPETGAMEIDCIRHAIMPRSETEIAEDEGVDYDPGGFSQLY